MGPKEFEAVKTLLNTSLSSDGRLPNMHELPDPNTHRDEFLRVMNASPILALEGNRSTYRVVEVNPASISPEFDKDGNFKEITFKGKVYRPNGSLIKEQIDAWSGHREDHFTGYDLASARVHYIPRSV